jgi:mannose-1-phosphate guanylyltransferase
MFAFEAGFMQEEFRRYAPEMAALVEGLEFPAAEDYRQEKEIKILDNWPGLGEVYEKSPSISFDYAIAEKCKKVFMLKASFTWSDVGSWDDYIRFATPSPEVFAVNAPLEGKNGNFVLSDIPVALCGVENLIVSICIPGDGQPAVALIARKGSSQDVKKIVSQIKTRGRDALL